MNQHPDALPELPPFGGSRAAGPLYPTTQTFVLHEAGMRAVSPKQAGAMLSVDRTTIYDLIHARELTSFHIGRALRVTVGSIDAYLARQVEAER